PELVRERRVGRELPAVALELLGEKALEPAALVTAGFVVDHPARAALVHEAAIDHDAPESPGREPGEGQLARRLTVSGAEQPPSALVGDRATAPRARPGASGGGGGAERAGRARKACTAVPTWRWVSPTPLTPRGSREGRPRGRCGSGVAGGSSGGRHPSRRRRSVTARG